MEPYKFCAKVAQARAFGAEMGQNIGQFDAGRASCRVRYVVLELCFANSVCSGVRSIWY
jgi:hypothetical protein